MAISRVCVPLIGYDSFPINENAFSFNVQIASFFTRQPINCKHAETVSVGAFTGDGDGAIFSQRHLLRWRKTGNSR